MSFIEKDKTSKIDWALSELKKAPKRLSKTISRLRKNSSKKFLTKKKDSSLEEKSENDENSNFKEKEIVKESRKACSTKLEKVKDVEDEQLTDEMKEQVESLDIIKTRPTKLNEDTFKREAKDEVDPEKIQPKYTSTPMRTGRKLVAEVDLSKQNNLEHSLSARISWGKIPKFKKENCILCTKVVGEQLVLTIPCFHFLCASCAKEWFKYSSHCPKCIELIQAVLTDIKSRLDCTVKKVQLDEEDFTDSIGAAYLFQAFISNLINQRWLDSQMKRESDKIETLKSALLDKLSAEERKSLQRQVELVVRRQKNFNEKKCQQEKSREDIKLLVNSKLFEFWSQIKC